MTTVPPEQRRVTYREVLAEPRFRVLFGTRSLAIMADALRIVALSVLVFSATGSPLLGALTFGIGFLPQIIGGTLLGALADRIRPRPLIVTGYVAECAVAVLLALVDLPVGLILALVALVATMTPVFGGASNKLVAEVLTGDAYVLGRSLANLSNSAAVLFGMAGGGVAVGLLGARHALLLTAGCHLLAAAIVRFRLPDLAVPGGSAGDSSVLRQSWTVNRLLLTDRTVRALLLAQWLPSAFVAAGESLVIPYASVRGFPASAPGLLLACIPVGMMVGNVVVGRMLHPPARERLVAPLVALLGLPLLALPVGPPLPVTAGLLVLAGCGFGYALGLQRPFLDAVTEPVRGQAFALLSTGLMTVQGVAPLAFGGLAELVPIGITMAASGAANLVTALLVWRWLRNRG
jgi:predicted MFS family arabinose efflux permease